MYYKEIYGLDEWMDAFKAELPRGFEVYLLKPFAVGFVELDASPEDVAEKNLRLSSLIISFCERYNIENHSFSPLIPF